MKKKIILLIAIFLLIIIISSAKLTFSQEDNCSNKKYFLLRFNYNNGSIKLISKGLETGCSPNILHNMNKEYNLKVTGNNSYNINFDPSFLFVDGLNDSNDTVGGANQIIESEFYLAIPYNKEEKKVELYKENEKIMEISLEESRIFKIKLNNKLGFGKYAYIYKNINETYIEKINLCSEIICNSINYKYNIPINFEGTYYFVYYDYDKKMWITKEFD
ncbi:MAG: hypothetical protein QW117_00525 [Candidatus Pacearchaeota archaeon]